MQCNIYVRFELSIEACTFRENLEERWSAQIPSRRVTTWAAWHAVPAHPCQHIPLPLFLPTPGRAPGRRATNPLSFRCPVGPSHSHSQAGHPMDAGPLRCLAQTPPALIASTSNQDWTSSSSPTLAPPETVSQGHRATAPGQTASDPQTWTDTERRRGRERDDTRAERMTRRVTRPRTDPCPAKPAATTSFKNRHITLGRKSERRTWKRSSPGVPSAVRR